MERLREYHKAAKVFSSIINSNKNKFEYQLQEGECVIFDNRRVLHGRKSFTSGQKQRWLKGAYLETDDFESQLRARDLHMTSHSGPLPKESEEHTARRGQPQLDKKTNILYYPERGGNEIQAE